MPNRPMRTVIICRNNAPLVKCLFDLIRKRIKARMVGRDVAKALKEAVADVLEKRRNCSIGEFTILLNAWIERYRIRFAGKEAHEELLSEYEDVYSCLSVMAQEADDARGLYQVIDTYIISDDDVTDDPTVVILTSSHRVKGLEFERAILIRRDLMPSSHAKLEADIQQEEHLIYVALTRGMHELYVCLDNKPD